jgi:integrase
VTGSTSGSPALSAGDHPGSGGPDGRRRRRRERVERNIYRRVAATGKVAFEVGYRDSAGKQRWQTVEGGITAARAARDDVLGRKGRGEQVRPNPGLRFGEASDAWLAGQVVELRPATQAIYRNAVETHLRPRWGRRRLDAIDVNEVAAMVRELRTAGKSEWTIAGVLKAANRVFRFANRRHGWYGTNPVAQMEDGERPKPSAAPKRRIYTRAELEQTLAAAREPWHTLFAFAAVTGARLSECLGLVWADLDLDDVAAAAVSFEFQVDRQGRRQPLKTDESRRTIELPRRLAAMLVQHKLASLRSAPRDFVFASRSGRALAQRNVLRALRRAQELAVDGRGRPTFPALHERDERGRRLPPVAGALPTFHSFRHTAASHAIAAGESAEEVSWQLGHRTASSPGRSTSTSSRQPSERRSGGHGWTPSPPCS